MTRTALMIVLIAGLLSAPVVARAATIDVGVNGLVCAFCAVAIEKTFGAMAGIQGVKVDWDAKLVTLALKPQAVLSDQTITDTMQQAGYTVTGIKRRE